MITKVIDMGSDFSRSPFGRYPNDGRNSGERFRKEILVPLMKDSDVVCIEVRLDSVEQGYEYGSSFLHEAFGVLVRDEGFSPEEVKSKIKIVTKHDDYKREIYQYVADPGGR